MQVGVEAVASSMRAELSKDERSMSSAYVYGRTDIAIRHLRRRRRQIVQRQRRRRIFGAGAALAVALGSAIGIASFTGTDLAGAAAARATGLAG